MTFLFTDIEGSTQREDRDRAAMEEAVRRHDAIVRDAIETNRGYVFKTIGDAFCAAFERPEDAVAAIVSAQLRLGTEPCEAALAANGYERNSGEQRAAARLTNLLRTGLDPVTYERLTAEGRALSPEAAFAIAIEERSEPAPAR